MIATIRGIGGILVIGSILIGCARSPMSQEQASLKTTYELCYGLLVYPPTNIHQSSRASELARRGENCNQYESTIRQQQQIAGERMRIQEQQTAQKCADVLQKAEKRAQTNCSGTFEGGYGQWNCRQATPRLPAMPECYPYWRGKVPGIY